MSNRSKILSHLFLNKTEKLVCTKISSFLVFLALLIRMLLAKLCTMNWIMNCYPETKFVSVAFIDFLAEVLMV